MSHTEQESASEALKRHFAQRVTNQARSLVNRWRMISQSGVELDAVKELIQDCEKLSHHAKRFEAEKQLEHSQAIHKALLELERQLLDGEPERLKPVTHAIEALASLALRRHDSPQPQQYIPNSKPVLLAISEEMESKLTEQLNHFGIENQVARNSEHFLTLMEQFNPCCIIADINFSGPEAGLNKLERWHQETDSTTPIVFLTQEASASLEQRLKASRIGGRRFFIKPNAAQIIRSVESYYGEHKEDPYKVLVLDDSKSQALFCDKALKAAGMETHVITDPMEVLNAMEAFQPEIIVMDMYMPGCTGTELASVIRQQSEYLSIPIVFLSGEEDVEVQLQAMRQGGDDFLTKPINPDHLAARVQNRGHRSRALNNLIVRDSLTGLFNHTHILDRLAQACRQAKENNTPLCFAMVDIDFFKKINDNYGHPVGDKVISALSLFLKQRLRKSDSIGRYGGEEFAIIMPATRGKDALHFLNDIREVFSQLEHTSGDTEFKVSFSCGICEFTGENAEHIIEQADEALYAAKKQGRNNVQLYVED
jgi:diguanylate cyclase (GGDEF)-like protein